MANVKKYKQRVTLQTTTEKETVNKLQQLAEEAGTSVSDLVNKAVAIVYEIQGGTK